MFLFGGLGLSKNLMNGYNRGLPSSFKSKTARTRSSEWERSGSTSPSLPIRVSPGKLQVLARSREI